MSQPDLGVLVRCQGKSWVTTWPYSWCSSPWSLSWGSSPRVLSSALSLIRKNKYIKIECTTQVYTERPIFSHSGYGEGFSASVSFESSRKWRKMTPIERKKKQKSETKAHALWRQAADPWRQQQLWLVQRRNWWICSRIYDSKTAVAAAIHRATNSKKESNRLSVYRILSASILTRWSS